MGLFEPNTKDLPDDHVEYYFVVKILWRRSRTHRPIENDLESELKVMAQVAARQCTNGLMPDVCVFRIEPGRSGVKRVLDLAKDILSQPEPQIGVPIKE